MDGPQVAPQGLRQSNPPRRGYRASDGSSRWATWKRAACSAALPAALSLVLGTTPSPPVRAQATSQLVLEWHAPDGCPRGSDVQIAVERLLGRPTRHGETLGDGQPARALTFGAGPNLEVHARVTFDGRFRAAVETDLGAVRGRRVLEAESCRALADATALIVALMIDPDAVEAQRRAGAGSPMAASASATGPRSLPPAGSGARNDGRSPTGQPERAPGDASASPAALYVGPVAAIDFGTLPSVALGGGGKLGLVLGRWWLEIGAIAWAEQDARLPLSSSAAGSSAAGGHFRLVSTFAAACPAWAIGRIAVGGRALLGFDSLSGTGYGISSGYANHTEIVSVGAGPFLRWRVAGRLTIPLRAEMLYPLGHPTFVLRGVPESDGRIHRLGPVVARGSVGLSWEF